MARPQKATVDYFPHIIKDSKTLFVLESKWGNDGYATWWKILEKIGSSDGHYLDCREEIAVTFLAAYCRISEETLIKILDTLSYLHAIDKDLWRHKVVFCQHFVDGVTDAYRRRKDSLPTKEKVIAVMSVVIDGINPVELQKHHLSGVNDVISTERERERESKPLSGKPDIPYQNILSKMNDILGTKYQNTDTFKRIIKARIRDGFKEEDFETVARKKFAVWGTDTKMMEYLRPSTLFGSNMDAYLNGKEPIFSHAQQPVIDHRRYL